MKQSFLISIENGTKRVRPVDLKTLAALLQAKQAVEIRPRLFQKVEPVEPKSANTYDTKVMVPNVVKRGRGRPPKAAQ